MVIHQFAIDCTPGDGITNGIIFTRKLLRRAGIKSDIYCADIHSELADQLLPMRAYQPGSAQALLIHHGIANRCEGWLESLPEKKFMVFHNITPGNLFPADHPIQPDLAEGWCQVRRWRAWLEGVIADSPCNFQALRQQGYPVHQLGVIPLLVDMQLHQHAARAPLSSQQPLTILFVGRIMPHKNQVGLVDLLSALQRMLAPRPIRLCLVGNDTVPAYRQQLEAYIAAKGLTGSVQLLGKVSHAQLQLAYQQADIFVSLSRHEGFGMPLIEAMLHDLPVLAYNAPHSNIAHTLGTAGVLLPSDDPQAAAESVQALLANQQIQVALQKGRALRLEEFEHSALYARLCEFMQRFNIHLPQRFL